MRAIVREDLEHESGHAVLASRVPETYYDPYKLFVGPKALGLCLGPEGEQRLKRPDYHRHLNNFKVITSDSVMIQGIFETKQC